MKVFVNRRPDNADRLFKSNSVESYIEKVKRDIVDDELAWMFENCFPNTLDTAVFFDEIDGEADSFIITGDIDAMWLRDSVAQIWPYLRFIEEDENIDRLFQGLISRHVKCILLDPYGNAFYKDFTKTGPHICDRTEMRPGVHERKWEIDSLCYFIRLSYWYWKSSSSERSFNKMWLEAARLVVGTLKNQQIYSDLNEYKFQRHENLCIFGKGMPTKKCGLIRSGFRPSDDPCMLHFLIPSNCFAVTSLIQLAEMFELIDGNIDLANDCKKFAHKINDSILKYGVYVHSNGTEIYAYEVDGFGGRIFMDDANIPSLLSLPYLEYCSLDDKLYQNTRSVVLSEDNPFFIKSKSGEGIGSPHVEFGHVWPMSIIMRALTSVDCKEIVDCIKILVSTHAGTGFMHESFNLDNPADFTRPWFGWANSLFGEMISSLWEKNRALLSLSYK